jgi:hypothetical protein
VTEDARLTLFVERLPWLAELGRDRLATLDRSDWHLPSEATLARLGPVGEALGVNLMFYRTNAEASASGLCAGIVAASLSTSDLESIASAENEDRQCVIVAYRRPVELRRTDGALMSEAADARRP